MRLVLDVVIVEVLLDVGADLVGQRVELGVVEEEVDDVALTG